MLNLKLKTTVTAVAIACEVTSAFAAVEILTPGKVQSAPAGNIFAGSSAMMHEKKIHLDEVGMKISERTLRNEEANKILEGKRIAFEEEKLKIERQKMLDEESDRKRAIAHKRAEERRVQLEIERAKKAERAAAKKAAKKAAVKPAVQTIDARQPVPDAPVLNGVITIDGISYGNISFAGSSYRIKDGSVIGGKTVSNLTVSGFDWGGRPVWNATVLNAPRVTNTDYFVGNDAATVKARMDLANAVNGGQENTGVQPQQPVGDNAIQHVQFTRGTLSADKVDSNGQSVSQQKGFDDLPPPPAYAN